MSNYQQAYPYGAAFRARDQSHPAYLPAPLGSTYQNQYDHGYSSHAPQEQGHAASNYNAYNYNHALPTFSAASTTPSVPPLPSYQQGWSLPLPPYPGLSNASPQTGYTNGSQHNMPYYPAVTHPSRSNGQAPKSFEQNELSEGEFEDSGLTAATHPVEFGSTTYGVNDSIQYDNAAQPAVYPSLRNYSPIQSLPTAHNYDFSAQDSYESQPQDSDSYSPCVSPREDNNQYRDRSAQHEGVTTISVDNEPINELSGSSYNGLQKPGTNRTQAMKTMGSHSGPDAAEINTKTTAKSTHGQKDYSSNGKSVAEEKKKALGAILNLWPYDVRYQTYIDEGFKEDFIKRLFDDLRLPLHSKSENGWQKRNSHQTGQGNLRDSSVQENAILKMMGSASTTLPQQVNPDIQNDSLGNSKQNFQEGSIPQQLGISGPISGKPSPLNDKERTIQAKMEALRKSREERAQKAAAQKNAKIVTSQAEVPPIMESKRTEANETPQSIPAPLPSTGQHLSSIPSADLRTQSMKAQPANPTIPGLFLSSTATSPAPIVDRSTSTQPNTRKRPVAADFDEPLLQLPAVKRPFGQSRSEQPLVIDISEDDADSDEDVAMDLESENNQDSPIQSVKSLHSTRFPVIPTLPNHSNFQTRTLSTPASSAPTTPPISHINSRSSLAGRPEDLQRKESEIELLKKKIAEAEARKKARQTSSGTRTPKISEANDEGSMTADINATINVEASIAMQRLIGIADNQVSVDAQRLLDVEAAELAKIEDIKRNKAEHIRIRRLQIENELPVVENEYQQNQRRLEEMRVEMAQIEANLQKYKEQKHKYTEEMARLGQEAENQLQQQKEKLQDLRKEESESNAGPAISTPRDTESDRLSQQPTSIPNDGILSRSLSASEVPLTGVPVNDLAPTAHSSRQESAETEQVASAPMINAIDSDNHVSELQSREPAVVAEDIKESTANDQALDAALQDEMRAESEMHFEVEGVDIGDSNTPDQNQVAPESPIANKQRLPNSPSQRRTSYHTERDSDDYEPPEATPSIDYLLPNQNVIDETTVTADDSVQGAFLDPTLKTISDSTSKDPAYERDDGEVLPPQNGSTPHEVLNIFIDPHNPRDADAEQVSMTEAPNSSYFTPYESPLRQFRAYRFHPDFQEQISGGLRSLTYSHKIDHSVEFCRYELAGGVCNDSNCDLLHFKDIGLPDDAILTALGSPEQFTGPRRDEFCAGLRNVLIDLRVRKIRDFDAIAAEILAYRKRFHGDPSKVLPLEGVSI